MQINTNMIIQISNDMQDKIDALQLELSKLITAVDEIDAAWKSDSGEAKKYVMQMKEDYISNLQILIDNIDICQDFLNKVPGAYRVLDDAYSNKEIKA